MSSPRRFLQFLVAPGALSLALLSFASGEDPAQQTAGKPAAAIDGFRFEFPCKEPMPETPKEGADCFSALVKGDPNKTDNFTAEKTFGGEPGKRYRVTLRVRVVVEPMMYKNGKRDGDYFYIGGEPGKRYRVTLRVRGVVEPMMYKNGKRDGDYFYIGGEPNNATYNIYKIAVSSPPSHYFLNRQDKTGHQIFTIDYTKTIEIDAGAKLTLSGDGQNGRLISNFKKLVVPDVAPAPQPFNGQFIQIDVVKIEAAK